VHTIVDNPADGRAVDFARNRGDNRAVPESAGGAIDVTHNAARQLALDGG